MALNWTSTSAEFQFPKVRAWKYALLHGSQPASFAQVIEAWQDDEEFRGWFNQLLATAPLKSFYWEMPPVTHETLDREFEFVLIEAPRLAPKADPNAFSEHFFNASDDEHVVAFPTPSGKAMLISPCPLAAETHYRHLGAFVAGAPPAQCDQLWQCVGEQMAQRVDDRPVWLSTAGNGVSWLHIRLDDSPKYYQYAEYQDE